MKYIPKPIDTSDVILSEDLLKLSDLIAKNVHEVWAQARMNEGWVYGEKKDSVNKTTPCMVPYEELSDSEKAYDINTALETLKTITKLGFKIVKE